MDITTRDTVSTAASPTTRLRRLSGYGAVVAVTPYLLVKVAWTLGLLLPTEQMGEPTWRAINAVTAALAVAAIVLALAFCRPWGERLPAWLVALPVWVGTGLLAPVVVLGPVLGPAAVARDRRAGAADVWAYEQVLVMVSLVGVGIGLPLALAGYVRARWPEALSGPLDVHGGRTTPTQSLQVALARLAAAGGLALGVTRTYWAAGGTLGIDPGRVEARDLWWHLLSLSTGVWAVAGAWGLLAMTTRRGARRFLGPMAAAWTASAVLFSQSVYGALSAARPDAQPAPEHPLARVLAGEAGVALGVLMVAVILLVLHDRQARPSRGRQ